MIFTNDAKPGWGISTRLAAAPKWKAKKRRHGTRRHRTVVEYARPRAGMRVIDLVRRRNRWSAGLREWSLEAILQRWISLQVADQRARERGLTNFATCQAGAKSSMPSAQSRGSRVPRHNSRNQGSIRLTQDPSPAQNGASYRGQTCKLTHDLIPLHLLCPRG
jgi:hypothetical protein